MSFRRGLLFCVFCAFFVNVAFASSQVSVSKSGSKTTTTLSSSGSNKGGGINSGPCDGKNKSDKCNVHQGVGSCVGASNGSLTCLMKQCNAEKGFYLEHYTINEKTGKCDKSGTEQTATLAGQTQSIQICGSKGFCRTLDAAKAGNKCKDEVNLVTLGSGVQVIAGCKKERTAEKIEKIVVDEPDDIPARVEAHASVSMPEIECDPTQTKGDDGYCQDCPKCESNTVKCEISVDNNECKYKTTCINSSYGNMQDANTVSAYCSLLGTDVHVEEEQEEPEDEVFSIEFELDGGTGCDKSSYIAGSEQQVKCSPTKSGFDVDSWTLDANTVSMPYTITKSDKGNKKFIVGWKPKNKPRTECNEAEKAKFPHATDFEFVDGECKPTKCEEPAYKLEGDTCVENQKPEEKPEEPERTECTSEEKAAFSHATDFEFVDGVCVPTKCEEYYKLRNNQCVEDNVKKAEDKYKDAKEKETSFENRMLGGVTMAATGIGGMELAQGLAEKSADESAERDMDAYLATFQCKIGEKGKTFTGGTKSIETPGANQLISLYQEYMGLAADLKERKTALGVKPGIESEVVMDKANMGLYDNEGHGIQGGSFASLYRAKTGSEADAAKLQEMKDASAKRVKGGAIALGVGAVGGMVGNSLLNGKLGEALKSDKVAKETKNLMKKDEEALSDLKKCLKKSGVSGTDDLKFEKFYPSVLSTQAGDNPLPCNDASKMFASGVEVKNLKAQDLFVDSVDAEEVYKKLKSNFSTYSLKVMIGFYKLKSNASDADYIKVLKESIDALQKKYEKAEDNDKKEATKQGFDLSDLSGVAGSGVGALTGALKGLGGGSLGSNIDAGTLQQSAGMLSSFMQ